MMHTHHIVFRSQGGLTYDLNLKKLSDEEHEGINGPHRNRAIDLMYKVELQRELEKRFKKDRLYQEEEIAAKLGRSAAYWKKNLRKVRRTAGMIRGEELIRHLMGGRLY